MLTKLLSRDLARETTVAVQAVVVAVAAAAMTGERRGGAVAMKRSCCDAAEFSIDFFVTSEQRSHAIVELMAISP